MSTISIPHVGSSVRALTDRELSVLSSHPGYIGATHVISGVLATDGPLDTMVRHGGGIYRVMRRSRSRKPDGGYRYSLYCTWVELHHRNSDRAAGRD